MTLPLERHPETDSSSDAALARRVRAGDADAYEALFRRYYAPLCRYARAYARSRDLAEDVVQDVLADVWRLRRTWVVRGTLNSYLYAAVRHRILNAQRRVAVERRWERGAVLGDYETGMSGGGAVVAPAADALADERALSAALAAGVASLPVRCREAFLLRRQHGLSYAEIATVMGIAPKTVEVQIGRALKTLRRALAGYLAILVLMR